MSAWLCSDTHLSLIAQALATFGVNDQGTGERMTAVLYHENQLSLAARYGDDVDDDPSGHYVHRTPEVRPEDLWMLTRSYRYQSCEHAAWDGEEGGDPNVVEWQTRSLCTKIANQLLGQALNSASSEEEHEAQDNAMWARCNDLDDPPPLWSIDDDYGRRHGLPILVIDMPS
jgi:hypothetical protein